MRPPVGDAIQEVARFQTRARRLLRILARNSDHEIIMCTLTWNRPASGELEIFFNRDELKTRPIAEVPSRHEVDGISFLSPRDPRGGGTWMLANEYGLVVCLLNKWELQGRSIADPRSRGQLVWSLANLISVDEVESRLDFLENYHAFTLVVFSKTGDRCWQWDESSLHAGEVPEFLTSSSFRFEEVSRERAACFTSHVGGAEFHASTGAESSAYTVRMNRPDAQTWSRSRLSLGEEVSWEYLAERPNLEGEPVRSHLTMALR